jgi:hypothetical protein
MTEYVDPGSKIEIVETPKEVNDMDKIRALLDHDKSAYTDIMQKMESSLAIAISDTIPARVTVVHNPKQVELYGMNYGKESLYITRELDDTTAVLLDMNLGVTGKFTTGERAMIPIIEFSSTYSASMTEMLSTPDIYNKFLNRIKYKMPNEIRKTIDSKFLLMCDTAVSASGKTCKSQQRLMPKRIDLLELASLIEQDYKTGSILMRPDTLYLLTNTSGDSGIKIGENKYGYGEIESIRLLISRGLAPETIYAFGPPENVGLTVYHKSNITMKQEFNTVTVTMSCLLGMNILDINSVARLDPGV